MTQTPSIREKKGVSIDYTPASVAVNAGDVIVRGVIPMVATDPISVGVNGALDYEGVFRCPKDVSTFNDADPVYWNPAGTPNVGIAGSGCMTATADGGFLAGFAVIPNSTTVGALTGDATVAVRFGQAQPTIPSAQFVTTAAGNGTLAAGNMEGATGNCILATSGATAFTTRTAAQLIANIPNARVGLSYMLRVYNTNAGTLTLTGGIGVTITGTATIATNVYRDYVVTITGAAAVTMQNVGSGTAN